MADISNKPQAGTTPQEQQPAKVPDAPSPGTTQSQARPCPQDCSKCSTQQLVFCSTKMLFDLSRTMQDQRRQQAELADAVAEIRQQLKKDQEAQLSIPFNGGE